MCRLIWSFTVCYFTDVQAALELHCLRMHGCAGSSGASLSAYAILPIIRIEVDCFSNQKPIVRIIRVDNLDYIDLIFLSWQKYPPLQYIKINRVMVYAPSTWSCAKLLCILFVCIILSFTKILLFFVHNNRSYFIVYISFHHFSIHLVQQVKCFQS